MNKTLLCLLLLVPFAHAERADGFQKTVIKARDSASDMVRKVTTLTGDVEIQRGTLLIQAEHAVLTEDAQGYQHVTMTTRPGEQPVRFRQKRDGDGNLWMDGEAQQVVYDDKTEVVDLLDQAKVRRSADGQLTDEAQGEHIVYSSRSEEYNVTQLPGGVAHGDRRGVLILQPVRKDPLISATAALQR